MTDIDREYEYSGQMKTKKSSGKSYVKKLILIIAGLVLAARVIYLAFKQHREGIYEKKGQDFIRQQYDVPLPNRTVLQQPRLKESTLVLWRITANNNIQSEQAQKSAPSCAFVSAANVVTKITTNTVKQLLHAETTPTVFILANADDDLSNRVIRKELQSYSAKPMPVGFDSDLHFALVVKKQCSKLVYLFGNFVLSSEMSANVRSQIAKMEPLSLFFTSTYEHKGRVSQLKDLSAANLADVEPSEFYSYLYIFDTKFFNVVTPTNFGYYAKYTVEEALLIPNLVLFQSSGRIYTNAQLMHGFSVSFIQFHKLALASLAKSKDLVCFISYPNQPDQINVSNAKEYLDSITEQNLAPKNSKPTVVLYVPYRYWQQSGIFQIATHLQQMMANGTVIRAKLRILANKVASSHAVYESVYSYCPDGALAISSRHNVKFHTNMVQQVLASLSVRFHYYFFKISDQNGQKITLSQQDQFRLKSFSKDGRIFEQKLRHVQVFKTDLMKMVPFWILKKVQVEFFQTEIPFVFNMLQVVNNFQIGRVPKTLATVRVNSISETEQVEIANFKLYTPFHPLPLNYLLPYKYNSLENPAFERNAPNKIPAKIHQIWLGKGEINELRMKLHRTLIDTNKNFEVSLWRHQNITIANFPISFNLLQTISEKHKTSAKSIYAMAADILRYEILLKFGGIYIDFKFEGHKPLDDFLKYETIFADMDIGPIRFGSPKAAGNPFLAATPNNYYLKMTLTQLVNEHTINFGGNLPSVTGAFVLRKSLTDQQLFNQAGHGYNLAIPNPYQNPVDYCGGISRVFNESEQIFEVYIKSFDLLKVGTPCNIYKFSYLVLVSPLQGTWLKRKEDVT